LLIILLIVALIHGCQHQSAREEPPKPGWWIGLPIYEINLPEFSASGDLDGAITYLDALEELGIRHLLLNPVHPVSGQTDRETVALHPYSVRDHAAVREELGGMAAFDRFVTAAHDRDMRVTLDMVLNHGSLDHVERQARPEMFAADSAGTPQRRIPAWRSIGDFDHSHRSTREYLGGVLLTWAIEHHVDGFRLIHASMLPGEFTTELSAALREVAPHLFLLAESPYRRHLDEGCDAIMNPGFRA
jgi:glycosidase